MTDDLPTVRIPKDFVELAARDAGVTPAAIINGQPQGMALSTLDTGIHFGEARQEAARLDALSAQMVGGHTEHCIAQARELHGRVAEPARGLEK